MCLLGLGTNALIINILTGKKFWNINGALIKSWFPQQFEKNRYVRVYKKVHPTVTEFHYLNHYVKLADVLEVRQLG